MTIPSNHPVPAMAVGDRVAKCAGDYRFHGSVRAVFQKRSGLWRVVVENDDGILHIFNVGQVERV